MDKNNKEGKPLRSSDNYIRLNKKITDKNLIKLINAKSTEHRLTPQDFCYDVLRKALIEMEKHANKKGS